MLDPVCRIAVLRVLPILRLGTGADIGPGALFAVCALPHLIVEFFSPIYQPGSHCHDSGHGRVRMDLAFDYWVPIDKHANSYTLWISLSSKWQLSQQRRAMPRSTVPSRKSAMDATMLAPGDFSR